MTLASSYPLFNIFLTTLWILGFFLWIWLAVMCFVDIFRSHDIGGFHKALWVVGIFVFPLLGVFIYLIARGSKMQEHALSDAKARDQATQEYIRSATNGSSSSTADEIAKLAALRDAGTITQEEFDQGKARLLSPAA